MYCINLKSIVSHWRITVFFHIYAHFLKILNITLAFISNKIFRNLMVYFDRSRRAEHGYIGHSAVGLVKSLSGGLRNLEFWN